VLMTKARYTVADENGIAQSLSFAECSPEIIAEHPHIRRLGWYPQTVVGYTVYYQMTRNRLLDLTERKTLALQVGAVLLSRTSETYKFWIAEAPNPRQQIAFGWTKVASRDLDRITAALTRLRRTFHDASVTVSDDLQIIEWDLPIDTYIAQNVGVVQPDVHIPDDMDGPSWSEIVGLQPLPVSCRSSRRPSKVAGVRIGAAAQRLIARVMSGGDPLPLHGNDFRSLFEASDKLPTHTPEADALQAIFNRMTPETLLLMSFQWQAWRSPRSLQLSLVAAAAVTDGKRVAHRAHDAWLTDRSVEPIIAALCANVRIEEELRSNLRTKCSDEGFDVYLPLF
jgi:hypothetical protein